MSKVSLNKNKTTYEELQKTYKDFRAPAYKIVVNNQDIVKQGAALDGVTVELSTQPAADTASFSIMNGYDIQKQDFHQWITPIIKLGNTVEISFGYVDKLVPLFFGYITNIDYNFSGGGPVIDIRCMDISFLMMRSGQSDVWNDLYLAEVVKKIAQPYSLDKVVIDIDDHIYIEVVKDIESDYDFLSKQAKEGGYEFFIVGKTMYFRKKKTTNTPLMLLEWGKHLISASVKYELSEQISRVVVRANLEDSSEIVIVESNKVDKIGSNSTTGPDIMKKIGDVMEVIQRNVADKAEAKLLADAYINEVSSELVTVDGSCIGIPDLRAGRFLELGGLGAKMNTEYRVVSTTHTIDSSGYITSFTLKGNAV